MLTLSAIFRISSVITPLFFLLSPSSSFSGIFSLYHNSLIILLPSHLSLVFMSFYGIALVKILCYYCSYSHRRLSNSSCPQLLLSISLLQSYHYPSLTISFLTSFVSFLWLPSSRPSSRCQLLILVLAMSPFSCRSSLPSPTYLFFCYLLLPISVPLYLPLAIPFTTIFFVPSLPFACSSSSFPCTFLRVFLPFPSLLFHFLHALPLLTFSTKTAHISFLLFFQFGYIC